MAKLTHIFRYPIKSSAAQPLESVEVGPLGLAGDRRWMLIDQASGKFITGRENGMLVQLQIEYSQQAADYSQMRLMWPGGKPVHTLADDALSICRANTNERPAPPRTDARPIWLAW